LLFQSACTAEPHKQFAFKRRVSYLLTQGLLGQESAASCRRPIVSFSQDSWYQTKVSKC
jgi:hypothetical protein